MNNARDISIMPRPSCADIVKLVVVILLATGLNMGCQSEEDGTYRYFRVVDETVYNKSPSEYELVTYPGATRDQVIYVERQPAHDIPVSGIVSVTIGKTKIYGDSPEERKELESIANEIITKGKVTKNKYETYPRGFFYELTFKLSATEWKRYAEFWNSNLKGRFEMRIGTHHQGMITFLEEEEESLTEDTEFHIATMIDDAKRITERLSPLQNKLIWE